MVILMGRGWRYLTLIQMGVGHFFTNGLSQPMHLSNQGNGQFLDVAFEVGLASREQHGGVASADMDNDGDPDLVIAQDCTLGTLQEDGTAPGWWCSSGMAMMACLLLKH